MWRQVQVFADVVACMPLEEGLHAGATHVGSNLQEVIVGVDSRVTERECTALCFCGDTLQKRDTRCFVSTFR